MKKEQKALISLGFSLLFDDFSDGLKTYAAKLLHIVSFQLKGGMNVSL